MARTKSFDPAEALDKARICFQTTGYHGTNLEELSHAMQISRSSLYNIWPDKQTLYRDALNTYVDKVLAETKQLLFKAEQPVPKQLKAYLLEVANDEQGNNGCFLINATSELAGNDNEVTVICKTSFKTSIAYLEKLLTKGQQEGTIRTDLKASDLANLVQHQITGLHLAKRINTPTITLNSLVDVILTLLKPCN